MTDELQRLHEAASKARINATFRGWCLTTEEHAEYVALRNAYADGSLIPAERYQALVEAAEDVRHEALLHIPCETEGKPSERRCKQLSCYPLCKTICDLNAALKEER